MTDREYDAATAARAIGTAPLMERSMGWLLGTLPKRLVTVITKLLSMKGVAFGAAFYLMLRGMIEAWAFVLITLVLIFGEKALTMIKDLKH